MKMQDILEAVKQRDPSSKTMQDIRKSGAAGAHKDKKKVLPRKEKHKGKAYEASIDKEIERAKRHAELNKADTARLKTAVDKEKEANKLKQLGHDASVARAKRYADRSKVKQGTRITDEEYKHADHAKGKDPMPKKSKPGKGPTTKHPLRGKLVGGT